VIKDGKIYNVGTGVSTKMIDVAKMLSRKFKHDLGYQIMKLHFTSTPIKNYVQHTQAEISKAKKDLGFEATYDLFHGLESYLQIEDWEEVINNG